MIDGEGSDRSQAASVAPGTILAGKYRVDRVLGAGGMGVVVAATHIELEQRVALKFLLPGKFGDDEAAKRFVREARAAAMIRSENVARVMDVGRLNDGSPYMVMEYLEGSDLHQVLQGGPLPILDAVQHVIQTCDALAEAHSAGIVHRDLKPANLFLTRRSDGASVVKVLDFGISKVTVPDLTDAGLTKTSAFMGSPFYMSPEQMRSARGVDHRTDIWSLGVILFEFLTGTHPFEGETIPDLFANIINTPARLLRELRPDAPQSLEEIISRCLQKDPDQRFANVAELTAALSPFGPVEVQSIVGRISRVVRASSLPPPPDVGLAATEAAAAGSSAPATKTAWSETGKGVLPKQRPWLIGASVAAVLVLVASVLVFARVLQRNSPSAPSTEPAAAATGSVDLPPYQDVPLPDLVAAPTPRPPPSASATSVSEEEPSAKPSKGKSKAATSRSAAVEATPVPAAAPAPVPAPKPAPPKPAPRGPKPPSNPLNIGLK